MRSAGLSTPLKPQNNPFIPVSVSLTVVGLTIVREKRPSVGRRRRPLAGGAFSVAFSVGRRGDRKPVSLVIGPVGEPSDATNVVADVETGVVNELC
jgi:hypothetical protein